MKQSLTVLARWANILFIIITLLAYLSPLLNPASIFWPISLLGLIYPILVMGNLLFILYWLNKRKWYFLFSVGCLLVGWSFLTRNVAFYNSTSDKEAIQIMTFNTENTRKFRTAKSKVGHDKFNNQEFITFLEECNIDIAVFQEFGTLNVSRKRMKSNFMEAGYHSYRPQNHSIQIISKYPIGRTGEFAFVNGSNGCVFADLEIEGKIVRLYGLHLRSNQITGLADKVAEEGNFRERETWQKVRNMFANYKNAAKIRAEQVEEIREHMELCPHPIVVCGDFNDVPQSFAYNQLAKGLKDSFQERGRGIGTTFSGSLPFLRIDYILVSPHLEVVHQRTERSSRYSDHYPVIAEVKW